MPKRKQLPIMMDELDRRGEDPLVVIYGGSLRAGMVWSSQETGSLEYIESLGPCIAVYATDGNWSEVCGLSLRKKKRLHSGVAAGE